MTTNTLPKHEVQKTWETARLQQESASALTSTMTLATRLMATASPGLLAELRSEWAKVKVAQFRAQGVKTPLDLARAWAEYETNLFGSKMRYWGDDNQAHVEYEVCGCWSALERMSVSEAELNGMSEGWSEMTRVLAKEFGFTGTEKIGSGPDEAPCTITFAR